MNQTKAITVVCGLIKKNNKYLVAKRRHGKSMARYWEFPGGKINENETAEAALVRELQEELQLPVSNVRYFTEHLHHYEGFSILLKAYWCETTQEPQILIDHDDYKWLTPQEIIDMQLTPADMPIADLLLMHPE